MAVDHILIAIPLFIFMAQILDQSGVAEKLFDVMRHLFGPVRGGIAVAVVVVSTLFGACTGIIGASVVTMGLLAMPVMLKYGYDKRLSSGCICAGGALGILIPPSIMLIVMGNQANLSVGKLFAGAIISGVNPCGGHLFYGRLSRPGRGDVVQDFILGVGLGRWMTFAIMMLICFVLGMFIDWIGIVMITFPIFLPIAKLLGFDPIWFVVIFPQTITWLPTILVK